MNKNIYLYKEVLSDVMQLDKHTLTLNNQDYQII